MTVWNLGSINIDHVYAVPHLPEPGETLAARRLTTGLGGKGANQSVAAARAGSRVVHLGAVGPEGGWARERMMEYGVEVAAIVTSAEPTGHAIINVDPQGENAIVTFAGANRGLSMSDVNGALAGAVAGDLLLLQNETSLQAEAARIAREIGMRVIYSAAPFEAMAVRAVLGQASILVMNRGEAADLEAALGKPIGDLPAEGVLVTLGSDGAAYHDIASGNRTEVPAFPVRALDTTGAGDTFAGYFAAALDQRLEVAAALRLAAAAAALKVTRPGAADAIPTRAEVEAFLEAQ